MKFCHEQCEVNLNVFRPLVKHRVGYNVYGILAITALSKIILVILYLTNVLCVPSFSFNLISASKLTKNVKCHLIFLAGFCFIQNLLTWKTIGLGKENGSLFHLMLQDNSDLHFPSITAIVNASPPLPIRDGFS
jgi:hypothetical protein